MKTHISEAVIMRVKPYGESDLMVSFFTPEGGRLKGVAKGARRSRRRFVNCLDPFSMTTLEYDERRRGDLLFLQSGRLVDAHPGLRSEFRRLSGAGFVIELTEVLFPWGVPDHDLFECLRGALAALSEGGDVEKILAGFEIRAMALGGYCIALDRCCMCGRIYRGKGAAVFKREKGGIACLGCERASALAPILHPESVKAIGLIQSGGWPPAGEPPLSAEALSEIRSVTALHRDYRLECRLDTARYI